VVFASDCVWTERSARAIRLLVDVLAVDPLFVGTPRRVDLRVEVGVRQLRLGEHAADVVG